ncbi:MAG: hypothetical protein AAGJ18_10540 [Bacteroidota bacterium]
MRRLLLFCTLLLFLVACDEGPEARQYNLQNARWEAVMANHDVVMPMMSTTNKVRKQLKQVLVDKPGLPTETQEQIKQLMANLDQADEGMMDWMNGFQQLEKLRENKAHKEILQYLDEQDVAIKKVGIDMTNAIKAGTDFMERLTQ